jgi:ABC-type amino acid transport substrate-binding protein
MALLILAVAAGSCGIPRDPRGTLDRVRGGTLRVGVAERAPWVLLAGTEPAGAEPHLLRAFARALGARIVWTPGTESQLLEALERGELDVVAGGFTGSTAWRERVALTRPYPPARTVAGPREPARGHVMAVAPGENGWLRELETFLVASAVATPSAPSAAADRAR